MMAGLVVQVDAAKTNRSLVSLAPLRRKVATDPQLLFWRRLIDSAVADAKRTYAGLPTDLAILQRWWLEEHKPKQTDKEEWERSFECACTWLSLDPSDERRRLLWLIDCAQHDAYLAYVQIVVYQRRAAVLTCAGMPTRIARQYVLPLVSELDFENVAGIDHPDPPGVSIKLERLIAA